jgi:signal transduction histidine kinase
LTGDLLLLARAEAGDALLRPAEVDLRELVEAAAATALRGPDPGTGRDPGRRPGQVRVSVADGVDATVLADAEHVRRVLGNLLDNAGRHDPGGRVEITITQGPPGVTVAVRDHGPGFAPAYLPHAFERFRRAESSRERTGGGTGLGLAIAATLVRAHRGAISAANHPDGGAVVTLTLPRGGPPAGCGCPPAEPAARSGRVHATSGR